MKALLFVNKYLPDKGGLATHAHELALGLKSHGWEILVVSGHSDCTKSEVTEFKQSQSYPIVYFKKISFIAFKAIYGIWILFQSILKFHPDLIIASGDREIYLTALLAKYFHTKWVGIEHGTVPGHFEIHLKRLSFAQADAVICVSDYTAQQLLKSRVVAPRVKVIPNGANPEIFKILPESECMHFRREKGLEHQRILITVGNIGMRKGQDLVIQALPQMIQKFSNVHYYMIGVETKVQEFSHLAQSLGVQEHVHFLGVIPQQELLRYLNVSEIFVMTSRHVPYEFEGYGIAVIEAALCQKPAVVSRHGGLTEAIAEGLTGLSAQEENVDDIAEKLLALLSDNQKRFSMAQAAYQRAIQEQTWEKRMRVYHDFFSGLSLSKSLESKRTVLT